jgi:PAS domain-containing protein
MGTGDDHDRRDRRTLDGPCRASAISRRRELASGATLSVLTVLAVPNVDAPMPWRHAASVTLDAEGRYLDADEAALELLGVATRDELRSIPPERFAAVPPDPDEQEAWRRAYFASRAEGVLAEAAFRRLDGELVRVRTAIVDQGDGMYRALFYVVERPTTNLNARVFRIADVLAEWRSAERRLVDLDPGSDEARDVRETIELLRTQHRELFDRASRRSAS